MRSYCFAFNGYENDNEIKGDGNSVNFGARIYDSRIGKFLSVDPKTSEFPYWSPYAFATNNPILIIDKDGEGPLHSLFRDFELDNSALLSNPNFIPLTTAGLRSQIYGVSPNLAWWKITISAGIALEKAYAEFTGLPQPGNMLSYKGDDETWVNQLFRAKTVRPDFVHATQAIDLSGDGATFVAGGIVEVKAPQNPLSLKTNNGQLDAEMNLARHARSWFFLEEASDVDAASYTIVATAGTVIERDLIEAATNRGVNLYVQYAYQNLEDGSVVFSNPISLNTVGLELVDHGPQNGFIHYGGELSIDRVTAYWRKQISNTSNNGVDD